MTTDMVMTMVTNTKRSLTKYENIAHKREYTFVGYVFRIFCMIIEVLLVCIFNQRKANRLILRILQSL